MAEPRDDATTPTDPDDGSIAAARLNIGTDEWVEQHGTRAEGKRGASATLSATWDRTPTLVQWIVPLAVLIVFPLLANGYLLRVGVNLGLFVMLALGLNVVVGYAGLLDLGYVAFYGFGAYSYALLSSNQFGIHLPTLLAVPIVLVASGALGLLISLPSRRLLGDYLAIVTLFFGEIFLELLLAGDTVSVPWSDEPVDITGGANGITNVDGWSFFGYEFRSNTPYFYLLAVMCCGLAFGLYRISRSRVGRAWRAIGEDALAAEAMTMPVKRLKLLAFVVGAVIAGLTGTVFAGVQMGVYTTSFDMPLLILLYAAVILGGAGSLSGAIVGGAVMSLLPEVLRQPEVGELLFFVLLIFAIFKVLGPKRGIVISIVTVVVGFVVNAILLTIGVPYLSTDDWAQSFVGKAIGSWLFVPADRVLWGNAAFVLLIIAIATLTRVRKRLRLALLPLVTWLAIFVWMVRLAAEPSLTRQMVIGAILIVFMIARPQGLFGKQRVEIQ